MSDVELGRSLVLIARTIDGPQRATLTKLGCAIIDQDQDRLRGVVQEVADDHQAIRSSGYAETGGRALA